jgi:vacuolar-type H+-ATPase subunit H
MPDVVHYEYEPMLRALGDECRRILASAHTEADRLRTEAREESHRMLTDARREQCSILERAARMQATLYEEVQAEVERRLRESEEQRASILRRAEADARAILHPTGEDTPADDTAPAELATHAPHPPHPLSDPSVKADLDELLAEVAGTPHRDTDTEQQSPAPGAIREGKRRWWRSR